VTADAAFAARPVAGGEVEQYLREPVLGKFVLERVFIVFVRGHIFDARESGLGGGGKAVEEIRFVEQKRQIGCESGHLFDLIIVDGKILSGATASGLL
jgi:hypothetical protein